MKQAGRNEFLKGFLFQGIMLGALLGAGFGQSVLSKAVRRSETLEPALVHPEQAKVAQQSVKVAISARGLTRPVWRVVRCPTLSSDQR